MVDVALNHNLIVIMDFDGLAVEQVYVAVNHKSNLLFVEPAIAVLVHIVLAYDFLNLLNDLYLVANHGDLNSFAQCFSIRTKTFQKIILCAQFDSNVL